VLFVARQQKFVGQFPSQQISAMLVQATQPAKPPISPKKKEEEEKQPIELRLEHSSDSWATRNH